MFVYPDTSSFTKCLLRPPKGQDLQKAELRMSRVKPRPGSQDRGKGHYHNDSDVGQGRGSQHFSSKAFFRNLLQKNRDLIGDSPSPAAVPL